LADKIEWCHELLILLKPFPDSCFWFIHRIKNLPELNLHIFEYPDHYPVKDLYAFTVKRAIIGFLPPFFSNIGVN
jgi:hypothetical protein